MCQILSGFWQKWQDLALLSKTLKHQDYIQSIQASFQWGHRVKNQWFNNYDQMMLFITIISLNSYKLLITSQQQIINKPMIDSLKKFREGLPIFEYKQKIQNLVCKQNFLIITGDTGSGKSTQLPQYMADSQAIKKSILQSQANVQEYSKGQIATIQKIKVICTQPRRMAAVSMADRVCKERGATLGEEVGYTIRFDDKTKKQTQIRYITDGVFVRQCINDPYLFNYHIVILDQAHERSLYTDILFALIKKAVYYRKGTLKLIVTSATLNTKTFSNYYNKCPVVQMHGKLYPVQVKYHSIKQSERVEETVRATIRMHLHEGSGDILVFLTGAQQCEAATRMCEDKLKQLMDKGKDVPGVIMYKLYGALSNEDQAQVFDKTPEGIRKIVFSTNIAQTSLTIDNIGFVVDCGFVKQKTYNPKTNMDSLVTVPISKVQAIQRKGRAGRTQSGKCLRLYSEKFYEQMRDYNLPEILRVSLNNVILTLKSMKIRDVINFQYIQNPEKQAIFKALGQLFLLSALNQQGEITQLGIQMSKFPLDPQYSKAVITSALFEIQEGMITLVSMLSTQSIWKKVLRINQQQYEEFIQAQKKFLSQTGDHQTLLNVYAGWMKCENPDQFCDSNFLNFRALRQADNIKNQLFQLLQNCKIDVCKMFYKKDPNFLDFLQMKQHYKDNLPAKYKANLLRKCLSIAFYFSTARLSSNRQVYLLNYPEGTLVSIDPTSALGLQNIDSPTVLFTQLGTGSSKGIMRQISIIDKKWIQSYMPRTKQVDNFKLAGIDFENKVNIKPKQQQSEEAKRERIMQERQKKIRQAKQRYEIRKKMRKLPAA